MFSFCHRLTKPARLLLQCSFPEPDDADRKKKTLKSKIKVSKASHNDSKPNISYPTNFEHTVHVGFDAITGEFTVSVLYLPLSVCVGMLALSLSIPDPSSGVILACASRGYEAKFNFER